MNKNISTYAELIVTSEYVTFNVWMVMFLEAQGYDIKNNVIFQDSQISIRMENNGRAYCTGNSRDINIRCWFVKHIADRGEIYVKYYPIYNFHL